MTELVTQIAWGALVLVHAPPAAALFAPAALRRLYGIDPNGDAGVLLIHRGALFLALVALSVFALLAPAARPAASVAVGISVLSFLGLYARAGFPKGPLRKIALVDAFAIIPLTVVLIAAWQTPQP